MATRGSSLLRAATGTASYRLAGLPVGFLTTLVTSRFLLPTGRGAFTLATLTVLLAASVLRLGGAVTYLVPRGTPQESPAVLRQAIVISVLLGSGVGLALVPAMVATIPGSHPIVDLAPLALPAMLVTDACCGYLLANNRVAASNRAQFSASAVALVLIGILVVAFGLGTNGAIAGWIVGQFTGTVFALASTAGVRRAVSARPAQRLIDAFGRRMIWLGVRFGIVGAITILNYRVDLILLRTFRGLHAVGIYSLAVSLAEIAWVLPQSVSTALTPLVVAEQDEPEAVALVARASRAALLLSVATAVALAIGAILFVPAVFGHAYAASTTPMLVLLPGVVAFAPGSVLATYISLRAGRVGLTGALAFLAAAVTVAVGLVLIPPLGATGAAIASGSGYGAAFLATVVIFTRLTGAGTGEFVPRRGDLPSLRALVRPARTAR